MMWKNEPRLVFSPRFVKNYKRLDRASQESIDRALDLFMLNPRHPSLRFKKMKGYPGIYEIRATIDIRITLEFKKPNVVYIRVCGHHDETLRNP